MMLILILILVLILMLILISILVLILILLFISIAAHGWNTARFEWRLIQTAGSVTATASHGHTWATTDK